MKYLILFGMLIASFGASANYCENSLMEIERYIKDEFPVAPIIDYGCLNSSNEYVRGALDIYAEQLEGLLVRVENLEDEAKELRNKYLGQIDKIEEDILVDLGNNALDKRKIFQAVVNLSQDIAVNSRLFMVQRDNMIAMGSLLGLFLPHLKGDDVIVQQKLGYESVEEVTTLREYLIDYGRDLRDAPVEIQVALDQLESVNQRINLIWKNYLQ